MKDNLRYLCLFNKKKFLMKNLIFILVYNKMETLNTVFSINILLYLSVTS